nr:MAG TPA: hypothetical protein [Caudoviricetes sp.]
MDKYEGENTSAFVPDFDSDLCDNSSIGCLDGTTITLQNNTSWAGHCS